MDIEIDNMATWPKKFRKLLTENEELIVSYYRKERSIDKLAIKDVSHRMFWPRNKYFTEYDEIEQSLEDIIQAHRMVAYHCTRLTEQEINSIKDFGINTLSKDFADMKIRKAVKYGYLPEEKAEYLIHSERNQSDQSSRTGMIWFCSCRSLLKQSGVHPFFQHWGGEALYQRHLSNDMIANYLLSIGNPCIIMCAIPIKDISEYSGKRFTRRLLSYALRRNIRGFEPPYAFDLNVKRNILAREVIGVVDSTNPLFKKMTKYFI